MLTSLLDMFTIILIFLIVSFEAEDQNFKLDPALKLPESSARSVFKPAVNIAVSSKGLSIEGKEIVAFENGRFPDSYYEQDEVPELIEVLERYYERKFADATPEQLASEEEGPIVAVQADKKMDYKTLFLVLKSCGKAGFVKYRLAVMKK